MNKLSTERRAQIISCLVEGNSIRSTVRITGAAKSTVTKMLVDMGKACSEFQDHIYRDLSCKFVECDEIWVYCYSKQKNVPEEHKGTFGYGDVWTWTALCADTKLVPSWLVGERHVSDAWVFMRDLESRLANRVQLTTDGHVPYLRAVDAAFDGGVDLAMIQKIYGKPQEEQRYSPATCIGVDKRMASSSPDLSKISTSYVERQNLTMRMGMRRFTRLTNGISNRVENLAHAVSLHYAYYNLARPHKSLDGLTPAQAAGAADHKWSLVELAELLD